MPKRGTFLDHKGMKWIDKQILPPLQHPRGSTRANHTSPHHGAALSQLSRSGATTDRYIFAVFPSSSGSCSSGLVTGYATGIWVDKEVGQSHGKREGSPHTRTLTSNSKSNSYLSWL